MYVVYQPWSPLGTGYIIYGTEGPFPNEDSPLTPDHDYTFVGPTNYWDWWYGFDGHPELWLIPENYDP